MVQGKWRSALAIAAAVLVLDQLAKLLVVRFMRLHQSIALVDGFLSLTHVRNTGAAFGLFAGRLATLQVPFFLVISTIAVILLLWFLRGVAAERRLIVAACGAVIGGALGNMLDRVALGEVIDFVDVYVGAYHWPAFNVADAAITVGVTVLCLDALWQPAPSRATR
jgi:signal peptidase II